MSHTARITVTENHLKLLRRMYVVWNGAETGAPSIDPKRPYGSTDVAGSVAVVIGDLWDEDEATAEDLAERYLGLHGDMDVVLQVVLCTGAFEPGEYEMQRPYDVRSWKKVG